ncbi:MAG: acyl-CoA thioesterase [Bosea sp.]|uniref:acyl-CoA thioesterase n=1 Tax=Bosea sp. (in: a-proteobacteria) TaxID=1871050 RepID=UPI00239D3064|nr:acyl-CoA thioesterase [Bosea sp. (in: a-proteobacteria)]MCP4737740.1 acyl-CoA thioesterase [Bosea sp. (in: a-proteobacteria)]
MPDALAITDFPLRAQDKLRYGDTDRQGHINNAVFSTFLETGRVELIYDRTRRLVEPGAAFVIARLELDFRAELLWPGEVEIGTRIASIGRSSVRLEQAIFQGERCVASGITVMVQMDETTRKARPFSEAVREQLAQLAAPAA